MDNSLQFGITIAAAFVIIAALSVVIIFLYIICKRKSSSARSHSSARNCSSPSISSINTPGKVNRLLCNIYACHSDERSHLLSQRISENNIPVSIPIPGNKICSRTNSYKHRILSFFISQPPMILVQYHQKVK